MIIFLKIKAEAKANLFASPDSVVFTAINADRKANPTCPLPQSAQPLNLKRTVQRQRQTERPPHPMTQQFTVSKLY